MPTIYEMPRGRDMAAQPGCDHRQLRSIRAAARRAPRRQFPGFSIAWTLFVCTVLASFCSRAVFMSLTIGTPTDRGNLFIPRFPGRTGQPLRGSPREAAERNVASRGAVPGQAAHDLIM